ncbi:MAG: DUF3261 domain-containing protein [Planctomycetes bacterium]|nr:DUF3261 domain-containing protein [Planctomycetota bacterium]
MKLAQSLALAALAAGCATPAHRALPLARGVEFDLLSPARFGRSVALDQVVRFSSAQGERRMHCALEIEPTELRLVALTPFETPAFFATFGGESLTLESALGETLPADPRLILADLQFALWPAVPAPRSCEVRERVEGQAWTRELVRDGRVLVRVRRPVGEPWASPLVYEHLERGYVLTVETLRCETLAP